MVIASLLSPELEDKLATFIALFVIFVVPAVLIVIFWLVHILPEQIAHKRNHPQFEAIRTLSLLSLVFGGLLWPIAWLWAYEARAQDGMAAPAASRKAKRGWARSARPPGARGVPPRSEKVRADIDAQAKLAGRGRVMEIISSPSTPSSSG
jgi:hypothetical protein